MPKIIKPAKGTFTTADITVDSSGRVIAASSGSAGGGFNSTLYETGPASGTYTGPGNGSMIQAYMTGGGGGGSSPTGRRGGNSGWGLYQTNISQPYSTPYSVNGGGTAGGQPTGGVGQAGGATNFAGQTANGGGGSPAQTGGNAGTFTDATFDFTDLIGDAPDKRVGVAFGGGKGISGAAGGPGTLWVWEA